MINNVVLVGRLTKDPELRYTPSGVANCRFTVAANRPFKSENGEAEADFINCVAWRKQAENLANFMRKGAQIGVIGRIQTGSYEKDGARVYTTDVVAESIQFLESRNANSEGGQAPQQQSYQQPPQNQQQAPQQQYGQQQNQQQQYSKAQRDPFAPGGAPVSVSEDDLPF